MALLVATCLAGCTSEPDLVEVYAALSADLSHVLMLEKRWSVRARVGPAGDYELSNPRYRWDLVTLDGALVHSVGWQDGDLSDWAVSDELEVSCLSRNGRVRVVDAVSGESHTFRDESINGLDPFGRFALAHEGDSTFSRLWWVDVSTGQPAGPDFSRALPPLREWGPTTRMRSRPGLYIEEAAFDQAWVFEPLSEAYEVVPASPYCTPWLAYRFAGCGDPDGACDVAWDGSVAVSVGLRDGELTLLAAETPTRISDEELVSENMALVNRLGRPITGDPDCWNDLVRR